MGLLRGTVIDDDFGDPVMYAEVRVEGLDVSTLTDLDGQYSFELAPGTYTLSVEFLGYAKQVVSEVVVKEEVLNWLMSALPRIKLLLKLSLHELK